MPWESTSIILLLPAFTLILFRVAGLFLTAPLFASAIVPVRIRAAMALVITTVLFPLVVGSMPTIHGLGEVVVGGVKELLIGVVMGLAMTAFLSAADLAGLAVGQQAGIVLGEVVDPTQNNRSSIMGQIYSISLMGVFILLGGHRATLSALMDTFAIIPFGQYESGETMVVLIVETLTASFMLAVRIAAPVLIALFLIGVSMAFLSRTMPQLNILTVGFGVRSLAALGTAGIALSACERLFTSAVFDVVSGIRDYFGIAQVTVGMAK